MRRKRLKLRSGPTAHDVPKLFAAFLIAMATVFAGAVTYSNVQHGRSKLTQLPELAKAGPPAHPARYADGTQLKQNAAERLTREDEQTGAVENTLPPTLSNPESRSHVETAEREVPLLSTTHELGKQSGSVPAQKLPQINAPATSDGTAGSEPPSQNSTTSQVLGASVTPQQQRTYSAGPELQTTLMPVDKLPADKPAQFPAPELIQKQLTIQVGSPVQVRLADTLSSDRQRTGDAFRAVLTSPVLVGGVVVANSNSVVLGRVVKAHKAPLIGGRSELTLTLTSLTGADGSVIPIETNDAEREGSHRGVVNTAKMAAGAVVGAVTGALEGAAEGAGISSSFNSDEEASVFKASKKIVILPAGTELLFSTSSPRLITVASNR